MAGSSNITGQESIIFADNASYDGTERGGALSTNGQLWIGSTASPHVQKGSLTSPDGSLTVGYSSPNITLQVTSGTTTVNTLSDDVGAIATPAAGNIQLVGHIVEQGATKFSTTVTGTNLININPMSSSRWIVDPLGFNGTHTTITTAIASATSGDTIILLSGTYTENFTLKSGVNFSSFNINGGAGEATKIKGKIIDNGVACGNIFSGICFETNGDNFISLTASGSSITLDRCQLRATDATGMSISSGATIQAYLCTGNLSTTGISYCTGAGTMIFRYCNLTNSGGSTTVTTMSGGLQFHHSFISSPISITGAGILTAKSSYIDSQTQNATAITTAGTGTSFLYGCTLLSGSASSASIGAGSRLEIYDTEISSSNTNAITGAGTVKLGYINYFGTSSVVNTTTQIIATVQRGADKVTAPGAYPYTTLPTDYIILVDTSSARTINLNASPVTGQTYRIKDNVGSAAANNITITPAAGNIDGSASATISTAYGSVDVCYNGTQWNVL